MLEVRNLFRRFPLRDEPALKNISFRVNEGDCIVISGANGSGKSVLMRLVAGLDRPTSGSVEVGLKDGKPARIGLVFQDADAQILGDTPVEDVAFGPRNFGADKKTGAEIAVRMLDRTGLAGKENVPARSLSGGEKRRLAVAGVLALDASLIIFDEPFANLDWPGVVQVNDILSRLKADGKTLIILTHELEKVLALANRLIVLYCGELVFDGTPEEALSGRAKPAGATPGDFLPVRLEDWGIRNPLRSYAAREDLVWGGIA